ncbi:Reverse transcriptase [Phytophthora palmivora]|uniref:Reverse transcriptase n=1 Tax=Phytophthora palmivora TaxID=4796 RepID=A0A2P4XSJ6_9STRA|nr:Reverse transcriptase [Phytophthora palmivora]
MGCTSFELDSRDREMYQGEDEILGVIAASITPHKEVDSIFISIAPRKQPRQVISMPHPTVEPDERLLVVSFDGSARVRRSGGAYSGIVWSLPDWTVISAASKYQLDLTENEDEYHGLLLCLDLLSDMDRGRLIICGNSNLVIRQMKGETECKAPGLTLLRQQALEHLRSWPNHEFLHMKRDWNQSADSLASAALRRESGVVIATEEERKDLMTWKTKNDATTVQITAVTRSRKKCRPQVLQEEVVHRMKMERINRAQDEEKWIVDLKAYLRGDVQDRTSTEAKSCSKIADRYETDESGLLFYFPPTKLSDEDHNLVVKLVVPETLKTILCTTIIQVWKVVTKVSDGHTTRSELISTGADYIRVYNATLRDGKRTTYDPRGIARQFTSYVSVPDYRYGSHTVITKIAQRNTELLIWIDLFNGYVIAKSSASRTAQTVAENYEECVFHRFGASEAIRHDREPGFMSGFFRSFNKIVGQRQRATMAYRPQANGTTERMVGTLTGAVKMYVEDVDQRNWDEYAESLTFALNTAQDRVRGDTPFYLLHGWDPRSTLEAMVPFGSTRRRDREPRRWRYRIQKQYQQAREQVNEKLRDAIQERADRHNETVLPHRIEVGTQVWLYLDRVKEGYARKVAHMWHGPFRVLELVDEHAVRLEIAGTEYRLFPVVHGSKIKIVRQFPDRPQMRLTIQDQDRYDFDEALLPEDSWIRNLDNDEYEVEKVVDMRSGKRTRYGRTLREFLVHWKVYDEPAWVDEADFNCGALLYDYLRNRTNRNRFEVMQSHEEP